MIGPRRRGGEHDREGGGEPPHVQRGRSAIPCGAFPTGSANCATPIDHLRSLPFYFADVRSDPINNADLGVAKNIAVREGMRIQLRLEFINAFNHPLLNTGGLAASQVVVNPGSATFGQTVASNQQNYARRAQFMAKFIF